MAQGEIVALRANMKAGFRGKGQQSVRKLISYLVLGETENRPPIAEGCSFTSPPLSRPFLV
jgi:hypothetical protein